MDDFSKIKKDFPIFGKKINGKRLIYLDSTATALKPQPVIEAMDRYYRRYSANVFRGIYSLSQKATAEFEKARLQIADFIGASSPEEIVFVRNTSEGLNLVAYSWGRENIRENDLIISTIMEHHSNFVPWQQLAQEKKAKLAVIDIDDEGKLKIAGREFAALIKKAKLLAIVHVSNVLGTINPIEEIVAQAKKLNPGITIVVDGAQAVPHLKVNMGDLGSDFYAFSGHKMLGPTGIGVLWGKRAILKEMKPFMYGGEMIKEVYVEKTVFQEPAMKYEAGTPDIAGAIGLGAAVDYLRKIGMDKVRQHEKRLTKIAIGRLSRLPGVTIYGPKRAEEKGGVIAFSVKGVHPHDLAEVLDQDNICIRSGHHCAMPLHQRLGVSATARASFYIYNDEEDIEALVAGVEKAQKIFNQ